MAAKKNKQFLKHINIDFMNGDGKWQDALIHVYLDEDKLIQLAGKAARNAGGMSRTGPISCRAYLK